MVVSTCFVLSVCICVFCNVLLCVGMGFLMHGLRMCGRFDNGVDVLVICVLVFIVFCVVSNVFYCFDYVFVLIFY